MDAARSPPSALGLPFSRYWYDKAGEVHWGGRQRVKRWFVLGEEMGKPRLTNLETGNVTDLPPFEVVVKNGLKARPKQHVDSVKEAVQYRNPSPLHHHRVRVRYLDH